MKAYFTTLLVTFLAFQIAFAQVAINEDGSDPDPSAMLDIQSGKRGLLVPRMSASDREQINHPAAGLIVYCKDDNKLYYYNGSQWVSGGSDTDWVIDGNNMYSGVPGNVGIDIESPQYKLDVFDFSFRVGNAQTDYDGDSTGDPDGGLIRTGNIDGASTIYLEEFDDPFVIRVHQTDSQYGRDLTLGMINGKFGINIVQPSYDLDVNNFSFNLGHNSDDINGDGFLDSPYGKLHTFYDSGVPYLVFENYEKPVIFIARQTRFQTNKDLILNMINGKLGIGIQRPNRPKAVLHVNGDMILNSIQTPNNPQEGHIYFDGTHFYGYAGGAWKQLDN